MISIDIMGQRESSLVDEKYQLLEDAFAPDLATSEDEAGNNKKETAAHEDATESLNGDDDDCTVNLLRAPKNASVNGGPSNLQVHHESFWSITFEILFPFTIAGLGMVGAGIVLDIVQHWTVFEKINELFILVPALLGLKGNLEMTLASRLSTQAHLGNMDTKAECLSMVSSNLALVQCQGIVVGFVASLVAISMHYISDKDFDVDHALLLCASSIVTASVASFALGLVMVGVIILSRRCKINPDNVATPIAASLGDLITLSLLSWIASLLFAHIDTDRGISVALIVIYTLFTPFCIYLSMKNAVTAQVLYSGWTPVLLAMALSSIGGLILDSAVSKFRGIAVFQPVFNGVGGNLVAVQASRISTHLHSNANFGQLPPGEDKVCLDPISVIFGGSIHSRTCRILMMLVIPGHLMFAITISLLQFGHTTITPIFLLFYILAAVLQIWILLHTAHWMIHLMWKKSVDPDNSAIPYLTALGDLLGGGLLAMAFEFLNLIGDQVTNEPITNLQAL